jgi:hypothetical protein
MSNEQIPGHPPANGGYERTDIGIGGVLYFLLGLLVGGILVYFVVNGVYAFLQSRSEADQTPVNPLVTNAPADTRHVEKNYPKSAFPDPKLEEDERGQLNGIRLKEEQTLSTYDYVDKNAGTIRIPIDRAIDLIAQRGLPTRSQTGSTEAPTAAQSKAPQASKPEKQSAKKKGSK